MNLGNKSLEKVFKASLEEGTNNPSSQSKPALLDPQCDSTDYIKTSEGYDKHLRVHSGMDKIQHIFDPKYHRANTHEFQPHSLPTIP